MFRVGLSAVLMMLVSLPNGICYCHAFEDGHEAESAHHSSPGESTHEDDPCDDDHECSCKLKPTLACDGGQLLNLGESHTSLVLYSIPILETNSVAVETHRTPEIFPHAISLSVLHCALRI